MCSMSMCVCGMGMGMGMGWDEEGFPVRGECIKMKRGFCGLCIYSTKGTFFLFFSCAHACEVRFCRM